MSASLTVHVAKPVGDQKIPALQIVGTTKPIPDFGGKDWERSYGRFYAREARAIVAALRASLPGGTWDRVVSEMVRVHATLLSVKR